ncbi:hypothetical protein L6452_21081 [Arctium lappa]|uniref:Uncharacterized protein n=1 Tax=Arctium lappa TaxID=4217 RepID=A0ACB9BF23_ARCLA|nr:hypothetical protein L6452_21081 [Arctium lappa]
MGSRGRSPVSKKAVKEGSTTRSGVSFKGGAPNGAKQARGPIKTTNKFSALGGGEERMVLVAPLEVIIGRVTHLGKGFCAEEGGGGPDLYGDEQW